MSDLEQENSSTSDEKSENSEQLHKLQRMSHLALPLSSPADLWEVRPPSSTGGVAPLSRNSTCSITVEIEIEKQRIVNVLDGAVSQLEIIVCLPLLIEHNAALLAPFCTPDELAIITGCFEKFIEQIPCEFVGKTEATPNGTLRNSTQSEIIKHSEITLKDDDLQFLWPTSQSISNITDGMCKSTDGIKLKSKNYTFAKESRRDPQLVAALELLLNKPEIQHYVQENLLCKISPSAADFLNKLRMLRDYALYRLSLSPSAKRSMNRKLRALWLENEQLKKEVIKLRETVKELINDTHVKLAEKNVHIKKYEERIKKLRGQYAEDQRQAIKQSKLIMQSRQEYSETIQANLKIELDNARRILRKNMPFHLSRERELCAKRKMTESRLVDILAKYDYEMGKRQKELDGLNEQYESEKKLMAQLKVQFDIQEKEFIRLMAQKEAEEEEELERRLCTFIFTLSARRIQRYWRSYRARKIARRKTKRKSRRESPKAKAKPPKENSKSKS